MAKEKRENPFSTLPACAAEYIQLVIKKMRWQKKVREDVQAELIAHFEDALKNCNTDEERKKAAKELISNFGDAKLIAILARRAKKRCRPLWQKIFIKAFQTFGIIIGLFILYIIWFLSGRPKITTNYVIELNRIVKPPTADNLQNAAVYYKQATEKIGQLPSDVNEIFKKTYYECNEAEQKSASVWIAQNKNIIELIFTGSEKPYYWQTYETESNEMLSIFLPHFSSYRSLVRMLSWNVLSLAERGDYNQALQNIITIYKFGRHIQSEPILVGQLVGIAVKAQAIGALRQILSRYDIESSELKAFQDNLQAITCDEVFTIDFSGEKLFMYDEIQRCFTENSLGLSHIYPQRLSELMLWDSSSKIKSSRTTEVMISTLIAIWAHTNKEETLERIEELYSYCEKLSETSPALHRQQNINLDEDFKRITGNNLFMQVLAPAIGKVIEIRYRIRVDVDATMATVAIIRYKQEMGAYPDNFKSLIDKEYLKEIPIDPYSDKPLVYRKIQNDFTLYSLGPDFDDDDGRAYKKEAGKSSIWPADANDGDAVFWPVANISGLK